MEDIDLLLSFLPLLYAEGFTPIEGWGGGVADKNGVIEMPWPKYNKIVREFVQFANSQCWHDHAYRPTEASKMIKDKNVIKNADLSQIKTMLTFFVRGERFCDGHWAIMIKEGYVLRLLQRLSELRSINA